MESRFSDVLGMKVPEWIVNPFIVRVDALNIQISLQESIIELQNDIDAKAR
jgi:hypothetical protein